MSASRMSKKSVFAILCSVAFLGACGEDAAIHLNQSPLADGLPVSALSDVAEAPDTEVVTPDTVAPDTVAPDTVVPPNDTDLPPDTITPSDVVAPTDSVTPGDVGPTDTIETDVVLVPCQGADECPDNLPCGRGACEDGFCTFTPLATGEACDDGEICTIGDRCSEGRCVPTGPRDCRDDNQCTFGTCVPGQGCEQEAIDCDDNNSCSLDSCVPDSGCVHQVRACPGGAGPCQVGVCDPTDGCSIVTTPDGGACDDGSACTVNDTCLGGFCSGLLDCDDGNVCTADLCLPNGTCSHTPLPGCSADMQCFGRLAGSPCNDSDATTTADMCVNGRCRGFGLHHLPGSTVSGARGLVIEEVDYGPDGWSAIFASTGSSSDGVDVGASSLARITNPAAPYVHVGTIENDSYYHSLSDGMVLRDQSTILAFSNTGWSSSNPVEDAVAGKDLGSLTALFSRADVNANFNPGARRTWVGGIDDDDEGVVLACRPVGNAVRCDKQELDVFESGPYPVAFAGVPLCKINGTCTSQWMGTATIIAEQQANGDVYFNDTYVNPTGLDDVWAEGSRADDDWESPIWAMAAWGTGANPRMLAVGGAGYLNYMSNARTWSEPLTLRQGQADRIFTGVSVSGDTVIVSATTYTANGEVVIYELWTVPTGRNAAVGSNWNVHELGRGPNLDDAGLYDVGARDNGEVMAVGGGRRMAVGGSVVSLDGLVYWRQAP